MVEAFFDPVGFALLFLPVIIILYLFFAGCLYKIAKRTKTENAFLSFIPLGNLYIMTEIAQKPVWWIVLLLIPIVNIIASILVWVKICKRMGRPAWWVVLLLIPVVNFVGFGLLAFGKSKAPGVQ